MIESLILAYVGPGAGLSGIGALIALIGAVLLALFGFVWYPVKRLLRKCRKPKGTDTGKDKDPE